MPAITSGHPSMSALAAFALGKLDAPAAETVQSHLSGCPNCRAVVETTPNDTLLGLFNKAATRPGKTLAPSIVKGTLAVPNPNFDDSELPAELRDHPRYRILRKLGEGGMGAVYQAEHRMMERVVAIKVISASLVGSPDAIERFQREVRAAAKLEHANIVRAYDADQAGRTMLLAMEFVQGRTLAEVIAAKGPLPATYACQCIRQAALGLQHAADHQMVHRDIKPQNLMLTEKGVVKILDFGLAKLVSERATRAGLTGKDMVMGTPEYMAPEQARDTASADVRADIYALGCTLFCLLTGRPPFTGATAIEIVTKQVIDAPPRVTDLRPDLPGELADLIGRMLAKDPAERPQTPKEVAEGLMPFTKPATPGSHVMPAKTPFAAAVAAPVSQRIPKSPARRSRWLLPTAVAVGVVFGTALTGIVLSFKTKGGVVMLQVDPPDAEVVAEEGKIIVTRKGDKEPHTISIAEGGGKVRISKVGFMMRTREVTLSENGTTIKVELQHEPVADVKQKLDVVPVGPVAALPNPSEVPVPQPQPEPSQARGIVERGNVALASKGATVTGPSKGSEYLLDGVTQTGNAYAKLQFNVPCIVTLPNVYSLRSIRLKLWDGDDRYYQYKLEVSPDGQEFALLADRTSGQWRGWQTLRFSERPVKAIRLTGTYGNKSTGVHIVEFEAYCIPPHSDTLTAVATGEALAQNAKPSPNLKERLAGTKWVNSNRVSFEWTANGRFLHNGVEREWKVLDRNRVQIVFGPDHKDALVFNEALTEFNQLVRGGPDSLTGKRSNVPDSKVSDAAGADRPPVALFNGRNLDGWAPGPGNTAQWVVEDGAIVGRGGSGLLFSKRGNYTDFHVRAEAKINSGGNSGLLFRVPLTNKANAGYEAQIDAGTDPYPTGSLYGIVKSPRNLVPADRWFTIEVIAIGNRMRIFVNDRQTVDYAEPKPRSLRGFFALQQHHPGSEVRFRKIEVKELK